MKDKGSSIVEEVSLDKQEVSENHENEHKDFDKLIDKAGIFLAEREGIYGEIQEGEEKRIVRKLDWRLLPMLFFTATLGAVDKQ